MANKGPASDISVSFDNLDICLEKLSDDLDLLRTVQDTNQQSHRLNAQTISRLEHTIRELAEVARIHQAALLVDQTQAKGEGCLLWQPSLIQDQRNHQVFQEEIRQIWEKLPDSSKDSSIPN